jgi:uncharacterized protein
MKQLIYMCVMFFFLISCDDVTSTPQNDAGTDSDIIEDIQNDADADAGMVDCSQHIFENIIIPMADGAELSAFVRRASDGRCALPTVLIQTPYSKENARTTWFDIAIPGPLFASKDYNFVVLDWRGYFGSAGQPENPSRSHTGYDGYDAVEWIAAQSWSDSNVGTWGISALCAVQYATAQLKPPHLKAMVPIFCSMNSAYDQYYPGGVLRREFIEFVTSYYGGDASFYEDHPYRDDVWNYFGSLHSYSDVEAPALVVAGWYDLYNTASIDDYHNLRISSGAMARDSHRLLIGPWIHGAMGLETSMGRLLTEQELKYMDKDFVAQDRSLKFFDFHLRGIGQLSADPVEYRIDEEENYANSPQWPPVGADVKTLYLQSGGLLQESSGSASGQFVYDPDDPSPTIGGQTLMGTYHHGPNYQDDVLARSDHLTFTTAPLTDQLTLAGPIEVSFDMETTGIDTDIAVRLTLVDDSGAHLLIGEGIQRLKLRDSYTGPSEVLPDTRYILRVALTNHHGFQFLPGDRIGLIVTSSNYGRFDVNPNTGDDFYNGTVVPIVVTNTLHYTQDTWLSLTTIP